MKTVKNDREFITVLVVSDSVGKERALIEEPTFEDEDFWRERLTDSETDEFLGIFSYYSVRSDAWNAIYNGPTNDIPEFNKAHSLMVSNHSTHALSYLASCGFAREIDG